MADPTEYTEQSILNQVFDEATVSLKTNTSAGKASAATTNGAVAVSTTSTAVLASNTSRKEFTLVNDSDTTIYLSLAATATANSGVRLNANGGSYTTDKYTGAVSAIHAGTGTKTLTVVQL